ncbi:MAG: protease pro-enzyme activation domain-containing protein [Terracidiphilus sp.]|jgi:hypothetical protein
MLHPIIGRRARSGLLISKLTFAALLVAVAALFSIATEKAAAQTHLSPYAGGQNTRALITKPIDEARLATLRGNTHPAANAENDRGPVEDSFPMDHMQLVLQRPPELEKALDAFMQEQQRKGSPDYHHWLSAKEFAARYGVSPQDIEKVSNWLQSHGFRIDNVLPNGMAIEFSGTAGQVRQTFHTQIHNLDVEGQTHFANMSNPQIPASLTWVVVGVHALHNFMPHAMIKQHSNFTIVDGYSTYYAFVPADLATIYNLNPAFANGITGAGQTIAVIEDTNIANASDVATFRAAFGLAAYAGTFSQMNPNEDGECGNPGVNGAEREAALDAEWAGASAPNANIVLASCADTGSMFGGLLALQSLINSANPPQIVSMSYGECEAENGATANASYVAAYQQAAAEGVSVFVSSGDEGAASCDADTTVATHGIAVSAFTSTPYNVSVGGTDFGDYYASFQKNGLPVTTYWSASNNAADGSALSYIPEIAWNDSCASQLIYTTFDQAEGHFNQSYGSTGFCNSTVGKDDFQTTGSGSGGPSTYELNNKPAWQSVLGNPSDNTRDIPDVSLFAANGIWDHFLLFCLSDPAESGTPCDYSSSNYTNVLDHLAAGGTSFSSPIMAGIQALINQSADASTGVGNPNPRYYALGDIEYGTTGSAACNSSLGNGVGGSCVFYDVTLGDIDVNCTGTASNPENCYGFSGTGSSAIEGALSTSTSTLNIAYGANAGWDFATGLGSVNAWNLIQNWSLVQTTTTVTSTSSTAGLGEPTTFTATITPAIGATETGTVTWSSNTGCAPSAVSAGVATCVTSTLPLGTDTITATYDGDADYAGSGGSFGITVAAPAAVLTTPTPGTGTILGVSNVLFQWTAGTGVADYQLNLSAVAPGQSELFLYKGTATSAVAATLPANAAPVYATLYSYINGAWQSNAYVYTESGASTPAALTFPTPGAGTILGTSDVLFQWNAGVGVADYQLNLSAVAPGGSDLYSYKGTALSAVAPSLPANGMKVYATLYSYTNGAWQSNAYVYTESGTATPAALISPTPGPGTILGTSNVLFQWNPGVGVADYQLNLSAVAPGDSDLFLYKGTALSATATTLPANGVPLYARLYSKINGVWQYNDSVYTEQ